MQRVKAFGSLALAAAIWGGMYAVSRVVLVYIPALPLVLMRILISLIVLAPLAIARKIWRISPRQLAAIAIIGIVGYTCSLSLQFAGTAATSASLGSLITSSSPAFIVLFAAFGGERPARRNLLALAVALVGVATIIGVDVPQGISLSGILILLGAAITWALYTVLGRSLARTTDLFPTLYWGLVIGGLALWPLAASSWPDASKLASLSPWLWLGIIYLGVVAMALAFFLWNYGFSKVSSDSGAVFFLLQPVVGTTLGVILLGERLTPLAIVGALFILAGATLAATKSQAQPEMDASVRLFSSSREGEPPIRGTQDAHDRGHQQGANQKCIH